MLRFACFSVVLLASLVFESVAAGQYPGSMEYQQQQMIQQIILQQQINQQHEESMRRAATAAASSQAATKKKAAEGKSPAGTLTRDALVGKWRFVSSSEEGSSVQTIYSDKLVRLNADGTMKIDGSKSCKWTFSEDSSILKQRIPGVWYGETVIEHECQWDGKKLTWQRSNANNRIETTTLVRAD